MHGNLGNAPESAKYIKRTLVRQLKPLHGSYSPARWSLDAAALSQYYVDQGDFHTARRCMAASQRILDTFDLAKNPIEDTDESIERITASISRCWIKYDVALLEMSFAAIENGDKVDPNAEPVKLGEIDDDDFEIDYQLIESSIACEYAKSYEEARLLFMSGMDRSLAAQRYYTLDGHCCDYIEIAKDRSQLFKLLANFETDDGRRARMHKRRVDLLMPLSNELNQQHYMLIFRQLVFELGEIYGAILDVKLASLEKVDVPSQQAVLKVNMLITAGLVQFNRYLDSLKELSTNEFPEKLSSEDERPCLVAKFYNARLYSKFVTLDIKEKINNLNLSTDCYRFIIDYCNKHQSAKDVMTAELEICNEMNTLLPAKIKKLYQE